MRWSHRFGRFELRTDERRLLVDGRPASLGARACALLEALVERRDRVVAKDELLRDVWRGIVVAENNLHKQVSALRALIGGDAIATIAGRGYQFTLPLDPESAFDHTRGRRASLRFGRFECRPQERLLSLDGDPVRLGARAFDVLIALLQRRPALVSKHDLLDSVWPGMVVEEHNLQTQVSTLRKLLGPDVIATVPGRGYRFAVPVLGDDAAAVDGAVTERRRLHLPAPAQPQFGRDGDWRFGLGPPNFCTVIRFSALPGPSSRFR